MALRAKATVDNTGIVLYGSGLFKDDVTFLQDAARAAALAPFTVIAQQASTKKWVPLTDVDPSLVPAKMVTGAIGGTGPEFAAVADGEFAITVDGEAMNITGLDFSGLDTVADTPGYMTCGALGGSIPDFQGVSDGQFGIAIDGNAAIQVGPLDFTGLDSEADQAGYFTCDTNGAIIAAGWDAVANGEFRITVNGEVIDVIGLDFNTAAVTSFHEVADVINFAAAGRFFCEYDLATNKFRFISNKTGETSIVLAPEAVPAGAGTDISAAGYLNAVGAGAAAVAGVGGEGTLQTIPGIINAAALGRFFCYQSGDAIVFVSPTAGETSSVSDLTAGTAGTDISGAAYLNGLAGTNVAGTGGEATFQSIVDIINAAAAGRFFVDFDGDAFVFYSPSGRYGSAISVLSAVAGGAGTDISGAGFLNGLTGTGTVTAATTGNGEDIPLGVYWGSEIAAATLVAGDVTNRKVLVGGSNYVLDEDKIVLENSLDLDDIVTASGKTIRQHLEALGIFTRDVYTNGQVAPI